MNAPNPIPGLLKSARQHTGLSQSDLARKCSIPQPNISQYESGKSSPTVRTMLAILEACDLELFVRDRSTGQQIDALEEPTAKR